MRSRLARVGILCAGVGVIAATVQAETVRAVYRIDQLKRCTFEVTDVVCTDVGGSFPVTLTFDSGVVNGRGDDSDRVRVYGQPTVTGIPASLRDDFPPLTQTVRSAGERARFSIDDQAFRRESGVSIRSFASIDANDFHRDVSLIATGTFPFAPELDAFSFARFLGTAPFRVFAFSDSVELSTGGFELLSIQGRPTLESPTATPEPASLLLMATGLAAVRLRRRRSAVALSR